MTTGATAARACSPLAALRRHWPEYLCESACLGVSLLVACVVGTAIKHPASPIYATLPNPVARRALMGLVMGLTAISSVYSPWGRRSEAHLNPATTLMFLWLRRVAPWDAAFLGAKSQSASSGSGRLPRTFIIW